MNTETQSTAEPTRTGGSYFGDCPHCRMSDGYLNIRRSHYGVCDEHKVFWPIGANLFSSWQEETEEDWKRNEAKLSGFTCVEPVFPDDMQVSPP